MAQLTWRNVDAPNFSGVAAGYKAFSDLISNAGKTASDAIGTYDDTTRMEAANPGIQAYFQAAAQGDPNATKAALAQHAAAFGNLSPAQLGKVFTEGSNIARTGINNQGDYFKNAVNQRTDADQQAAIAVLNKIGPGLGSAQDVYPMFRNSKEYNALSETGKRLVQQGVLGMGYQFQGPSAIGGAGVPSLGSGSPATAAIGGAVAGGVDMGRAFSVLKGKESNYQQYDGKGNPLTSPKGAIGGSQILPTTGPEAAKLAGLPWNPELFSRKKTGDAAKDKEAIDYNDALGMAYFGQQLKDFDGNLAHAYAAYNAGPAATKDYRDGTNTSGKNPRLIKTPDGIPPFKETQDYVQKNMATYGSADPAAALAAAARPNTSAVGNAANSQDELTLRKAQNNAGGMSRVFTAMKDTESSPASIVARWADEKKFVGASPEALNGKINKMVEQYGKYGVTPAAAAAILEGGGLRGITDWSEKLGNIFNAESMGNWTVNENYIEGQVEALKNNKTLVNAEANRVTSTADAMLTKYREEQVAATAELNARLAAARSRPELLEVSVPQAQARVDAANAMLRQLSQSQQSASNLQPVLDKPQPVATTVAGKAAPAIASAVSQTPAETYKANPGRNMWQEQQQAAAESRAKSKAEKDSKRAAEAAAKVEEEIRVEKARQEYLRRFGRVSLAPSSN